MDSLAHVSQRYSAPIRLEMPPNRLSGISRPFPLRDPDFEARFISHNDVPMAAYFILVNPNGQKEVKLRVEVPNNSSKTIKGTDFPVQTFPPGMYQLQLTCPNASCGGTAVLFFKDILK